MISILHVKLIRSIITVETHAYDDVSARAAAKLVYLLFFFLLYFGIVSRLVADDEIRYGADATRLPVGTDIAAMGDAGVVLPRRVPSSIWNPAAAAFFDRYEFSAEGADLYCRLAQQACFAATAPLRNNIGASICYQPFYTGLIEQYDSIPEASSLNELDGHRPTGYFRNFHHTLHLTVARNIPLHLPRFSEIDPPLPIDIAIGTNLKIYAQSMNPDDRMYVGMGYNADIGLQIRLGLDYDMKEKSICRELILGATLRDPLPSDIVWIHRADDAWMYSPDSYREPFSFAQYYGIAFSDRSGDLFANWTIALALHKEYDVTYHGGIEAEFWDMVSFRIGFSDRTPTVGAGFRYRRIFMDYAFRFEEIAVSFVRLTLGVSLSRGG